MQEIKVSVVAPAYNESGNLPEFVRRTEATLSKAVGNSGWELLVIDDCSRDNTAEVLGSLKKKYPNLRPINHTKNRGQTGCFDTGFKAARGKIIITMDSDLEVYPEDLPMFIKKMDDGADITNGIRTNRKHTFAINFASRIYNILMFLLFKSQVYDAASNYTSFKAEFVKGINLKHNDHRYIIPIAQRRGAKEIDEAIIRHDFRKSGISKYKAINKFISGLFEIIYAWFRIQVLKDYDRR